MASDSLLMKLVIKDYKPIFKGLGSLVDVGGGTGTMARIISETFPHMKCTGLDLPHVAKLPDSKNLKYVGGDIFQYIPPADAILFKWILHNWSDEECVNVLKNCKEAIMGKVMMVLLPGKERSQKEWEKLFLEAGFSHYKIVSSFGMRSLIEVYP
nr:trans-resveratrol di-o-methyltransferase [Quercus suber]